MKAMGQCLHFGKSVQDNEYGLFREMLDYKLAWQGKKMIKVDRFFHFSKKCCKCGRIKKELKLSERVYHCECGNKMDRDRNAAINIREEARSPHFKIRDLSGGSMSPRSGRLQPIYILKEPSRMVYNMIWQVRSS